MRRSNLLKTLLIIAVAGGFASCGGAETRTAAEAGAAPEKVKVSVQEVSARDVEQVETLTATVTAQIVNNIAPKIAARIDKIYVEVGDRVKKGQILAEMDKANLEQARLKMVNDSIEFERTDQLYRAGGTSRSEWDARKMAYDVSETSYRDLLENTVLISPISGIVTARNYDQGDMYSGQALYVVEQIRPVKLLINVSESLFTHIRKGMPVDITTDVYGDEVFKGRVSLIYPTIDPATRTFPVEVSIDNADEKLRPGMFARVTFAYGTLRNVVVPDVAVVKQTGSGDRYIYVYRDGAVFFQKVELGRRMDKEYEILNGIEDGDRVVISGQTRLNDGMEVDVVE